MALRLMTLVGLHLSALLQDVGTAHAFSRNSPSWRMRPPDSTAPSRLQAATPVFPGSLVGRVDEYYSGYEYQDPAGNDTSSGYISVEPGVIPDPGLLRHQDDGNPDEQESLQDEPEDEVELPDNSLADTDLHDHDLIDSVMYIYFGAPPHADGGASRQVLIVGAVISLMAQCLSLATALRRVRACPRDPATLTFLNTELSLITSNLVFMLGVQATGDHEWCEAVALLLHYLHLVSCCWFFATSVHVYQRLREGRPASLHVSCPLAWLLPAMLVLACYVVNSHGYETRHYCWMSVERGMLLSYMAPVATLIMANTVLPLMGLRLVVQCDLAKPCMDQDREDVLRKSLKVAAMLLPLFAVVWFLGVVALENPATLVLPLLFVATSGFLNWFLFICSSMVFPECDLDSAQAQQCSAVLKPCHPESEPDTQPLLAPDPAASPIWGHSPSHRQGSALASPNKLSSQHTSITGELLELRLDSISTIST